MTPPQSTFENNKQNERASRTKTQSTEVSSNKIRPL